VSERGLPIADSPTACPFVAFDDDRDERATVPDHRHRCYAELRPAPRALAHQEAYCLSSAFPVCPTFQDWARREAARAQDAAAGAAAVAAAAAAEGSPSVPPSTPLAMAIDDDADAGAAPADEPDEVSELDEVAAGASASDADGPARSIDDGELRHDDAGPDDGGPRRNPPRDWSAPPPWLASSEAGRSMPADPPDFLAGRSDPARGLAGSAADLLAGGSPPRAVPPQARPAPPPDPPPHAPAEPDVEERDLPRPAVPSRRPRAYDQHLGGPSTGPDWERPRRYEAYPTIKTRMSLPSIPRLAGMAAAIALAAVALFFLPALLGLGANDEPTASRSPSPAPSRSIAPTEPPAATPIVYIIKKGDTLSKIAVAHGISLEELRAANPTIKDPNLIKEGQQITIPAPAPSIPDEFGGSAAPSP
jgi:LysM domain